MSNISMVEANLPPGFRFHPRDEELVCDYLMKKVTRCDSLLLVEVDLNKCEPWEIPETASVGGKEWYFYSQRDRKYATGLRTNRATASGYWKATGKDRTILRKNTLVGMRKTLVFYQGRAPKGSKTDWVMHEFRIEGPLSPPQILTLKEDWVLCRVFHKNSEVPVAMAAKPSMGRTCYDDTGCSSSLPPLMDSYITFDQTEPPKFFDENEQVSCFSIFNSDQPNNSPFSHITHMEDPLMPTENPSLLGQLPMTSACVDPFPCDNKVIKAVLSQLTRIDDNNVHVKGSSASLGEGSSESYLSDVGMPYFWNNDYDV
ncbi:hypothetical protein SLE2022_340280 [Rubroshorea leprosula]